MDAEVQDEGKFENKVYTVGAHSEEGAIWSLTNMQAHQKRDPVTLDAREQLTSMGRVTTGSFRGIAELLKLSGGILLFNKRVVVPKDLQEVALVLLIN